MEKRPTFDELKKGDLLLCCEYDSNDTLNAAQVLQLTENALNKGGAYNNGVSYVIINTRDDSGLTLPTQKTFVNFREFSKNEKYYYTYETISQKPQEIADARRVLGVIYTTITETMSSDGALYECLLQLRKVNERDTLLNLIETAREHYELCDEIASTTDENKLLELYEKRRFCPMSYKRELNDY